MRRRIVVKWIPFNEKREFLSYSGFDMPNPNSSQQEFVHKLHSNFWIGPNQYSDIIIWLKNGLYTDQLIVTGTLSKNGGMNFSCDLDILNIHKCSMLGTDLLRCLENNLFHSRIVEGKRRLVIDGQWTFVKRGSYYLIKDSKDI